MRTIVSTPIVRPIAKAREGLSFHRVLARLEKGLSLFTGAPLASPLAVPFCAPFLLRGKTVVAVDGANCFNLYRLTAWARRKQLPALALLSRLRIARAFTPFQLATILHHIGREMEQQKDALLIISGLPDCLYDEELSEQEARSTFARCQADLARLAERYTVMAFSDQPAHLVGRRTRFLDSLVSLARFVFAIGPTEPLSFVPVKAPGLLTLPKGAWKYGENPTDR